MKADVLKAKGISKNMPLTEKFLLKQFEKGKNLQEIYGYSDSMMDKFYLYGVDLYNEGRYTDASDIFLVLVNLNPLYYQVWLNLGMSEQLKDNLDAAKDAFEMAIMLSPNEPNPYLHSARCFLSSNDWDIANCYIALMKEMVPNIEDDPNYGEKIKEIEEEIKQSKIAA